MNRSAIARFVGCSALVTIGCDVNKPRDPAGTPPRDTSQSSSKPAGYVSRAEFGEKWPLTVDDGVLACDQSSSALGAVVFSSGGRRYALNGTAKGQGIPPIDPIWRETSHELDYPPLARLPETQRQRIFADTVKCEEGAGTDQAVDACHATMRRRYKVSATELRQVSSEGVSRGWPPLSPPRPTLAPLIERGLQLCERR